MGYDQTYKKQTDTTTLYLHTDAMLASSTFFVFLSFVISYYMQRKELITPLKL